MKQWIKDPVVWLVVCAIAITLMTFVVVFKGPTPEKHDKPSNPRGSELYQGQWV